MINKIKRDTSHFLRRCSLNIFSAYIKKVKKIIIRALSYETFYTHSFLDYWMLLWLRKIRFLEAKNLQNKNICISVIIPAMNEEHNIGKILNSLKTQNYSI